MPKKSNRVFNSIMKGLDEALEWSKGKTKMSVIMPGQKRKQMTRDEYEAEKKVT
jgi:hypothetical protein